MSKIAAKYYDGESSGVTAVLLHLDPPDTIRITGLPTAKGEETYTLAQVKISERIGSTPRSIYLPCGAKCETENNTEIDTFLKGAGKKSFEGYVHLLENRFAYAALALIITALALLLFIDQGIPALARRAAFAAPVSINTKLGSKGLAVMDRLLFKPTEISEKRQVKFETALQWIAKSIKNTPKLKIAFRKGAAVGANAFALPDGTIILTDELIELSKDDKEITAVLAHEAGHVAGRHFLRMILQNSTVALIISSVTGDLTGITALSSAIPTILVEAKYSKEFEMEADTYALKYLKASGIETIHFANILTRMSKKKDETDIYNYLSSHPATEERIKRFK